MEEAAALMASGDATSAAAMDFARRFRAWTKQLMSGPSPAPSLTPKLIAMMDDARSAFVSCSERVEGLLAQAEPWAAGCSPVWVGSNDQIFGEPADE